MTWSLVVGSPEQARRALAEPGDALDLRADGQLAGDWAALGFEQLVPDLADGVGSGQQHPAELVRPVPLTLPDVAATRRLGARLAAQLRPGDLVVLSGPLGAGKTALTQGIGDALGVRGPVTSPTFVLARVHRGPVPLVHVDAYRLRGDGPDAAGGGAFAMDDLDLDAELPAAVVVVEWGQGLVEGLSDSRLDVHLERPPGGDGAVADTRRATVRAWGRRWAALPPGTG